MTRIVPIVLAALALSTSAFAQMPPAAPAQAPASPPVMAEAIERALAAAPRQMKDAATVIKWNPDFTYETLRKGTNRLVCYDRSGEPGEQAFSVQCTSLANLERVAQNRKFESETDPVKRKALFDAAEADGSRVKPEFGSVWLSMAGADQARARIHTTIAVPGATTATLGLPENGSQGGVWIMNAGTTTAHLMTPGS